MGSGNGQRCVLEERLDVQQRRDGGGDGGSGQGMERRQRKGPGVRPMVRVLPTKAPTDPGLLAASQSTGWGLGSNGGGVGVTANQTPCPQSSASLSVLGLRWRHSGDCGSHGAECRLLPGKREEGDIWVSHTLQCPLASFPPLLCTSLASLAQGSSQLLPHGASGAAFWLLGPISGALFSWHGASSLPVMRPLPLPASCLLLPLLQLQAPYL